MSYWHFCDDYTVTAASQEACSRLLTTTAFTLLHSFGLKNSNQFEKFQPVLKKCKPKKNLNHNIIMLYKFVSRLHLLCIHVLSVKEEQSFPLMSTTEFFYLCLVFFSLY